MTKQKKDWSQEWAEFEQRVDKDDPSTFLEDSLFEVEVEEMLQAVLQNRAGDVLYGDGDVAAKAKRTLKTGARQILEGKTPAQFLTLLAHAINNVLAGKEDSLDAALRLSPRRGRQPVDPAQYDGVIEAYCRVMGDSHAEPDYERRNMLALEAAFTSHHKRSRAELRMKGIDAKSIGSMFTQTTRLLRRRGYMVEAKPPRN